MHKSNKIHIGKRASRMTTLSIFDLKPHEALYAARRLRRSHNQPEVDEKTLTEALSYVGGRLSFISKLVKTPRMEETARNMVNREKGWLLSQIGLIPDHDDDVMDEVCHYRCFTCRL